LAPFKEKVLAELEQRRVLKEEEAQRRRDAAKALREGRKVDTGAGDEDMELENDGLGDDDEDIEDLDEMELSDDEDDGKPRHAMAALLASARQRAAEYEHRPPTPSSTSDADEMEEDFDADGSDDEGLADVVDDDFTIQGAGNINSDLSRKAFDKVFKRVLSQADVILYVLDARDPNGTRSQEVERAIMASANAASGEKRLILVLNKIDLVPQDVLKDWLKHLRRYFPTLPLRASTPAPNAKTYTHPQELSIKNTADTLFKALKSFAKNREMKGPTSVGVIGYPNVGKSSVINVLTSHLSGRQRNKGSAGSGPCPTGSEAGVTRSLRTVKLDGSLKLLDSPGIVFPSTSPSSYSKGAPGGEFQGTEEARLILLNALPPAQITDPIPAITLLLHRLRSQSLTSAPTSQSPLLRALYDHYDTPALPPSLSGDETTAFLVHVARKRGRLGKGGVPNVSAAAMAVLNDYRDGRIGLYQEAPVLEIEDSKNADKSVVGKKGKSGDGEKGEEKMKDQKEIVSAWGEEFKLEGLWGDE
jgi:nuclear GTP-binding protein